MTVQATKQTHEGAKQYEHTFDHALEFFSKAGSMRPMSTPFYNEKTDIVDLFRNIWISDPATAFKLMLWVRDCRGGAGNRSGFRYCLRWVALNFPEWISANLAWIPTVGRWDDLRTLFGTKVETETAQMWWYAIFKHNDILATKWADRSDKPLLSIFLEQKLGKDIGDFRRALAKIRSGHIVEYNMCTGNWSGIKYPTVPSVAMARYTNAFKKHDLERFEDYKESLKKGEATVHASVLFPHDCCRTAKNGDKDIANAQFEAMPNFLEGTGERIMPVVDTSWSMNTPASGQISAMDVARSLGLYCSAKVPADNPFYKRFIIFSDEGHFINWEKYTFADAVTDDHGLFKAKAGWTCVDKALDLILDTAVFYHLTAEQIPSTLLIISDMQFAPEDGSRGHKAMHAVEDPKKSLAEVQKALSRWQDAGYPIPKVIYWNTAGYAGSPETKYGKNVAMVSGFSPAILKNIFNGKDLTPLGVMNSALEKYTINVPK